MNIVSDFSNLLYPNYCAGCGHLLYKNEQAICLSCQHKLPKANFHDEPDNPVEKIFWGRVRIVSATAFLRMPRKGSVHRIIHELKYKQNPEAGVVLGKLFGLELKNSQRMGHFDAVIPVPLHPEKRYLRGYNQCERIAQVIAQSLGIPCHSEALLRTEHSESQTRKHRYNRWENVNELFVINPEVHLQDQHILLIDDVITTGATLEACAAALLRLPGLTVSIGAIALPVRG